MTLYEGLFLLDLESKPEPGHEEYLLDLLKRCGASVVSTDRWGERKLSFEIKRKRRGLYFLIHFEAPGTAINEIRRACKISEFVLRELIVVDEDGKAKAAMDALLKSTRVPADASAAAASPASEPAGA